VEKQIRRKRKVLEEPGIARSTYYRWRQEHHETKLRVRPWNRITANEERRILAVAREFPELSSRHLSAWITDHEGFAVSESTVYRILSREGLVKRQETQLTAAKEYHTKTTRGCPFLS
jgi:putative transposase